MKYPLLFSIILTAHFTSAQTTGKILFEEKVDFHRNLTPEREEIKHMIPQFSSSKWELIFKGDESIYQAVKEKEISGSTAYQPYMRMNRENRIIYKHLSEDKVTDSRDFMQKQFLIKGFTTNRKWKISTKQKMILGYNCMEATFRADSVTVLSAWFTPQIAVSNGPADYQGLPGMILQIDINDGERRITATEIQFDNVDTSVIAVPTKGKEITWEAFENIRKEKMKEMNAQQKGSEPVRIIRYH